MLIGALLDRRQQLLHHVGRPLEGIVVIRLDEHVQILVLRRIWLGILAQVLRGFQKREGQQSTSTGLNTRL